MYGILGTGAIDCIQEEELCNEFLVFDTPSIMVFTESANDDGEKYDGVFKWNKIANFASKKMQSFLSIVHDDNYDGFIQREPENYKVLVFSDRKNPSALLKHLSKYYNNKLLFGYVRKNEAGLISKFGIQKFPSILVLTEPSENKYETYSGEANLDQLKSFFREYAFIDRSSQNKGQKFGKYIF